MQLSRRGGRRGGGMGHREKPKVEGIASSSLTLLLFLVHHHHNVRRIRRRKGVVHFQSQLNIDSYRSTRSAWPDTPTNYPTRTTTTTTKSSSSRSAQTSTSTSSAIFKLTEFSGESGKASQSTSSATSVYRVGSCDYHPSVLLNPLGRQSISPADARNLKQKQATGNFAGLRI